MLDDDNHVATTTDATKFFNPLTVWEDIWKTIWFIVFFTSKI